jgi:predicted metal-binding membrane protein
MEIVLNKFNNIVGKRFFVIACLSFIIVASWGYLLKGAGMPMGHMSMMKFMNQTNWDFSYSFIMFMMWWVMMIAMMLPSAMPMVLIFNTLNKRMGDNKFSTVMVFASAYLLVWGGFSLIATAVQWGLVQYKLLATMGPVNHKVFSAGVLIAGGLWQFTSFKNSCLEKCRSPLQFLSENWRTGTWGSFVMGSKHGLFCLGCCWFLMTLLFYGGVMNLLWIIGLTLFVLIEKLIPPRLYFSKITGVALLIWGLLLLFA